MASEPIEEGEFIDEYRGEVIDLAQITKRTNELYRKLGNYYYLDYDTAAGEVIDSGLRGNITRFANHSVSCGDCHFQMLRQRLKSILLSRESVIPIAR